MSRLLLVSNRLPVTVRKERGRFSVAPSSGGLATGLKGPHDQLGGLWFGWPGEIADLTDTERTQLDAELRTLRTVPVWLSRQEIHQYYDGLSNGVLWPLFHYLLEWIPLESRDWEVYRRVNERFADLIVEHYRPGDLIWVQDFHLLLLPAILRRKLPDATIGFFLHTPFPSYEVFRLLPWRDALLKGMLGCDVIGFHTAAYLRHFATSVLRILGHEIKVGRTQFDGREISVRIYPMGIDAATFSQMADDPEVIADARRLRDEHAGAKIILGIDRLDYTKGIPRRLLAYERFLEQEPSLRRNVKFIQVAVPSRLQVHAYESFRRQVEELIGRINGAFGTLGSAPIHYLFRNFTEKEVVTMYRAADVMMVTPLRDGMNLVAKEYVACRNDEDGVLILSEFAGASSQLGEAIQVNPYDIGGVSDAIKRAITMERSERDSRMRSLRGRVARDDVHHWAASFLRTLERSCDRAADTRRSWQMSSNEALEAIQERILGEPHITLLLDYDGTLVPFQEDPDSVVPDEDLHRLLLALANHQSISLHLVSGRKQEKMEEWFRELPIGLHAEHGLWSRWGGGEKWVKLDNVNTEWKSQVRPILEEFADRTFGAFVEEKGAALVWHYRQADVEYGGLQAKELRLHLLERLSNLPVEILAGNRIVEVRAQGVHKGMIVASLLAERKQPGLFVAFGDDRTDEDLFAALPRGSIAIHVGPSGSVAPFRIADPLRARELLARIARARALASHG